MSTMSTMSSTATTSRVSTIFSMASGHLTLLAVALVFTLPSTVQAQNEGFPNTKEQGRAATEYRDDAIQLVAAYYYSQRNHESTWLLIEVALTTEERMTIHRDALRLITPDGTELALATQERFSRDVERVRQLVQNARTSRHGTGAYFNRRNQSEEIRFFSLPGSRLVANDFRVDRFRFALGDLFFESPTGAWQDGIYTLVLEHEETRVAVPIVLE